MKSGLRLRCVDDVVIRGAAVFAVREETSDGSAEGEYQILRRRCYRWWWGGVLGPGPGVKHVDLKPTLFLFDLQRKRRRLDSSAEGRSDTAEEVHTDAQVNSVYLYHTQDGVLSPGAVPHVWTGFALRTI